MDARRRQPSASISVKSEDTKAHVRRGSHSATPLDDEDGENSRRSTRGRNPLPPTRGPLFPPLPPKQPKQRSTSIRLAPPSPSVTHASPVTAPKSPSAIPIDPALADPSGEDAPVESKAASPGPNRDEAGPSGSVVSLTPPPPTSEDAAADIDDDQPTATETAEATSDLSATQNGEGEVKLGDDEQWEVGQRQHAVRSFPKPGEVKEEQEVDDDTTPRKATAAQDSAQVESDVSPPPIERADSSKLNRKRRGEEQLLLDDHLLPAEMRRTGSLNGKRGKGKEEEDEDTIEAADDDEADGDDAPEDITRCVCKLDDEDLMMIQCDDCNVWQHGPCMGIWADEEAPDEYYCEQCRPDLHGPLRKWIRSKGRNATYIPPPTPADLQRLHHPSDKHPPSQSKRWTDPALNPPPAPPPKPPVRSHHRKEAASPVDSTDGRRGSQGGPRKPPPTREKPSQPPAPEKPESKKKVVEGTGRRGVTVASPSPSRSPPPNSAAAAALKKRRSTMNSRYDDEVYAVMEASRMEQTGEKETEEETIVAHDEPVPEEKLAPRKGKRKREDDEGVSEAGGTPVPSTGKPKHPNQYTYRPKPVSTTQAVASPMRRVQQGSTPVPSLPPPAQHDHGTRRAGAIANGTIPPPPNSYTVNNLHWHLPDHLASFADIFPTPDPVALEPRLSRSLAYLPRNHFLNQKYGPFSEERDEAGKLVLPEDPGQRETSGDPVTQLEPPARVRYPAKRITTAEVRKRVRNMLEYVSRVQQEEAKRKQRAELIGINIKAVPPARRKGKENEQPQDEAVDGVDAPQLSMRYGEGVSSEQLMNELMRDLIGFQESFTSGGGLGVSPMPPTIATFSSAPVTPAFPSAATFATTDALDASAVAEALGLQGESAVGSAGSTNGDDVAGIPGAEVSKVETSAEPATSAQPDSVEELGTNRSTDPTPVEPIAEVVDVATSETVSHTARGDLASAAIDTEAMDVDLTGDLVQSILNGDTAVDDSTMDIDVDVDPAPPAVPAEGPTNEPVKDALAVPNQQFDALEHPAEQQAIPIDPALLDPTATVGLDAAKGAIEANGQQTEELEPAVEVYREGRVEEVVTAPEEANVGPEGLAA